MKGERARRLKLSRQARYRARPEFIVNSDFFKETEWTKGDGWAIEPNALTITWQPVDFYVNGEWVGRIE